MQRKNREIVIFNLSAIDLFCSGMGAVMVLMVLLMPYYRKQTPPEPEPALVAATRPEAPEPEPEPVPIPSPPDPVPAPSVLIHDLELMIVIDTTASMGGALDDLRTTLGTIVNVLSRLTKNLKVGVVAYRDRGDEYLVRGFPLRQLEPAGAGLVALSEFLRGLKAGGGGDVHVEQRLFPGCQLKLRLVVREAHGAHAGVGGGGLDAHGFPGGHGGQGVALPVQPVAIHGGGVSAIGIRFAGGA
jgi:hypothetical protein